MIWEQLFFFVWENQTSSTEKVGNIPIEFEAFAGFFQKVVGKIQETLGKGWSMYVWRYIISWEHQEKGKNSGGPEQVILKDKAGKIDATREWRPLWTVLKS